MFKTDKENDDSNYHFKDTFSILSYEKSFYNQITGYWKSDFPFLGNDIKTISCGDGYSFFLTKEGKLYSCGRNDKCQLGLNPLKENIELVSNIHCCKKVSLLKLFLNLNVKINNVICGSDFTFACDETGVYYSWGSNVHAQLARKTSLTYDCMPAKADLINNGAFGKIQSVHTGWMHGCLLSDKGEVFVWGNPFYDYDKTYHNIIEPLLFQCLYPVIDLTCGFHHFCLIVNLNQKYLLMTFGVNDFGQLGYETNDPYTIVPDFVKFPEKEIEAFGISEVACGAFHTICRIKDVLYGFGQNDNKQVGNYSAEYVTYPIKWNYELDLENKDDLCLDKIICSNGLTVLTYKTKEGQSEKYLKNQENKEKYSKIIH